MLGLRFCARAFSSCSERGPLFIAVRGPLTIAASLVAEHRLQTRRLRRCLLILRIFGFEFRQEKNHLVIIKNTKLLK